MRNFIVIAFILLMSGCAWSTGVVPIDKDTYMVSVTRKGFVSGGEMMGEAYVEANEFCAKQNKKVKTTQSKQRDMVPFTSNAYAEINFVCLDENDPEYVRPDLKNK